MSKLKKIGTVFASKILILTITSSSVCAASFYVLTKKVKARNGVQETTIFKYNSDGLLISSSSGKVSTKYKYDKLHRVKVKTYSSPSKKRKSTFYYKKGKVTSAKMEVSGMDAFTVKYNWVSKREVNYLQDVYKEYKFANSGKVISSITGKLDFKYDYDADGFVSAMKSPYGSSYTMKNIEKNGRLSRQVRYRDGKKYDTTKIYYKKISINNSLRNIIRKQQYCLLGMGVPFELIS